MNPKKRSHESRSRGNNPPDKRSRPSNNVASSLTKHKEDQLRSEVFEGKDSSAASAKSGANSLSSGDARLGLRVDTSNSSRDIDAVRKSQDSFRAVEYVSGSRRSSAVLDSRQVLSPASIRSGSSTPVQAAPQAPSMVPSRSLAGSMASPSVSQSQSPRLSHTNLDPMDRMKDIRLQHIRKQTLHQAQDTSQSNDLSNSSEIALKARIEQQSIEITELKKDRDATSARLRTVEASMADLKPNADTQEKIADMAARLSKVEATASASTLPNDDLAKLQSDVSQLLAWKTSRADTDRALRAARNHVRNEIKALETRFETRINTEYESIKSLSSMANTLDAFRKDTLKQDLQVRVDHLFDSLKKLTGSDGRMSPPSNDIEHHLARKLSEQVKDLSYQIKEVTKRDEKTCNRLLHLEIAFDNTAEKVQMTSGDSKILEKKLRKDLKDWEQLCEVKLAGNNEVLWDQVSALETRLNKLLENHTKSTQEHTDTSSKIKQIEREAARLELSMKELREPVVDGYGRVIEQRLDTQNELVERPKADITALRTCSSACATSSRLLLLETRVNAFERSGRTFQSLQQQVDTCLEGQVPTKQLLSNIQNTSAALEIDSLSIAQNAPLAGVETSRATDVAPATLTEIIGHSGAMSYLQVLRDQFRQQKQEVRELNDRLEVAEKEGHDLKELKSLQYIIPNICKGDFGRLFHPFRERVDAAIVEQSKMLRTLQSQLAQPGLAADTLQNQPVDKPRKLQQQRIKAATSSRTEDLISLRVDLQGEITALSQRNAALQQELATQRQQIEDLTHRLELKADNANVVQNLNQYTHSFKALQDRYDNIYTDELHMKMVHWFMQQFPHSTADLINKVNTMSVDLDDLKQGSRQLSQLDVAKLVAHIPHLDSLADLRSQIQHLPQDRAAIQEALGVANEALQPASQSAVSVGQLQTSSQADKKDTMNNS